MSRVDEMAGRFMLSPRKGKFARFWLKRPFTNLATTKVLIIYNNVEVSLPQVYPFLQHSEKFFARYGAEFRCFNECYLIEDKLDHAISNLLAQADLILLQPWFDIDQNKFLQSLKRIRAINSDCKIIFLDSYAHTDVRLGHIVNEYCEFYIKKSIFRDVKNFYTPFVGGTMITEFYSKIYKIEDKKIDWRVPPGITEKLKFSPTFLTAPQLSSGFSKKIPNISDRNYDVHARLGSAGTPWYNAMRTDAIKKINQIDNLKLTPSLEKVDYRTYMQEMRESYLCFSPFGYGEICWRDVEAFQSGSLLIKPSMDHLSTYPDLYEDGVTYLACKWDFSDLEEVVRSALANESLRHRIVHTAYARCAEYLKRAQFVDDMAFLFEGGLNRPGIAGVPRVETQSQPEGHGGSEAYG